MSGSIPMCGVVAPVTKNIYDTILEKLEREGIRFNEYVFESPDL
jgi:hypothetical protein